MFPPMFVRHHPCGGVLCLLGGGPDAEYTQESTPVPVRDDVRGW